ncbi:MAG: mechanosensitive ion channel domain-containing protein [Rhodanobacteraceae bacterium]
MPDSIAQQIQHTRADALGTFGSVLRHISDFLNTQLINTQGIKLTIGAVIAALVTLLIVMLISRVVRSGINRYAGKHRSNQAALYTVSQLVHYALLVIGVMFALSVAGIPLSKFEIFAGALGVGLGFGMQAIFSNFVSGLIILFDRSLKVGDFVELSSGVHGTVRDIHIRATLVTTNDNIDILVPNSAFVTNNVVNWTLREASRRQRIPFGVAYGSDKELVKKAALEAAAEVPFTLAYEGQRRPQVWLTGFGDSSLDFALVVWLNADAVKRPGAVAAAYNWALHTALEKYDIEIPFPQRDLHVRSWSDRAEGKIREARAQDQQRSGESTSKRQVAHHERARLAENDAAHDVEHEAREARQRSANRDSPVAVAETSAPRSHTRFPDDADDRDDVGHERDAGSNNYTDADSERRD